MGSRQMILLFEEYSEVNFLTESDANIRSAAMILVRKDETKRWRYTFEYPSTEKESGSHFFEFTEKMGIFKKVRKFCVNENLENF